MAKKGASGEPQPPVVVAVFEDLIKRLEPASVDALRSALFSEEPLP